MTPMIGLLFQYAAICLLNTVLSGFLYFYKREQLYKPVFIMWAMSIGGFLLNGAVSKLEYGFLFSVSLTFTLNFAYIYLACVLTKIPFDTKFYLKSFTPILLICYAISVLLAVSGKGILLASIPISLMLSIPFIFYLAIVAKKADFRTISLPLKWLFLAVFLTYVHYLDFPYLQQHPILATAGFSIALFLNILLMVSSWSAVIESVTTQKAQSDAEIAEAQKLQSKLTPKNPNLPHLNLDFQFTPSSHVGGDFLNIEQLPGGETARILLGDVTSHGMEAALGTFISNTILTVEKLKGSPSVKDLCSQLNDTLVFLNEAHNTKIGLTFVAMDIDPGYRARFFGSHDPMIWYRAASQSCEMVSINSFPFRLGTDTFDLSERDIQSIQLEKNDVLFMYTDGLTEGRKPLENGKESEFFGLDRLKELVRVHAGKAATEISSAIREEFDQWTQKVYDDDVCFIVVKV